MSAANIGPLFNSRPLLLMALLDGPDYATGLARQLDTLTDGSGAFGDGSIYPALRKLERSGYVVSRKGNPLPERGGRSRIYYELTNSGLETATELQQRFKKCAERLAEKRVRPSAKKERQAVITEETRDTRFDVQFEPHLAL